MIPEPVTRYRGTTPVARARVIQHTSLTLPIPSCENANESSTTLSPPLPLPHPGAFPSVCVVCGVSCVQKSVSINFFLNSNLFFVCVSYHTWLKNLGYILKQPRIGTSLLPPSMGHNQSDGQSRFKGWRDLTS